MKIKNLLAYEILDSRGNPTIEVRAQSESGIEVRAGVPSGASTGIHEALELRDNDPKRFGGKGMLKACANANTIIAKAVVGMDVEKQKEIDKKMIELDGTENKSKLGANAILGVSLACARLAAKSQNLPLYKYINTTYNLHDPQVGTPTYNLPTPLFNIINGGKHADSGLDIQEFMLVPIGLTSSVSIGDEGGFAPKLGSNERALDFICQAIVEAGYTKEQVKVGMDVAASSFYKNGQYHIKVGGQKKSLTSNELIDWYKSLIEKYPIIFIEDSHAEDDWQGFSAMLKVCADKIKVVGDDLLVTNIKRIKEAIKLRAVNAVLIKLNQIGTLSQTIEAIMLTQKQGWVPIISHRSGETIDDFIADLAVAVGAQFIKAGAPSRGERVAKYNRLLAIEKEIYGK
jgi:enolase